MMTRLVMTASRWFPRHWFRRNRRRSTISGKTFERVTIRTNAFEVSWLMPDDVEIMQLRTGTRWQLRGKGAEDFSFAIRDAYSTCQDAINERINAAILKGGV